MGLNPFKDSNLNDLQQNLKEFFSDRFGELTENAKRKWELFVKKGKERITIMFIPHTEKKILNFHISIFAIASIVCALVITIVITSIVIVNHTSTIKEISRLKMYGSNSKVQIIKYREEINKLYDVFQKMKPEVTHLYKLTPDSNIDALWAKGGVHNPDPVNVQDQESERENLPPLEVLNIEEMERELKTTKEMLERIKVFLEARRKVIENTPSSWPVDGYVISRFGERISSYSFRKEYHQGIDIASFPGADIRATAPGKVENVWWDPITGLSVQITHKYGFSTVYSHCQRVSADIGQKVSKGDVIAYVGKTGKATRAVCFYQVRVGTDFVDPAPYLNKITR